MERVSKGEIPDDVRTDIDDSPTNPTGISLGPTQTQPMKVMTKKE
jgi:hypothetical protein